MATLSIVTTPDQDRAIAYFVGRGMAEDAAALVQAITSQELNGLIRRAKETTVSGLSAKLATVDDETLGAVAALLDKKGIANDGTSSASEA